MFLVGIVYMRLKTKTSRHAAFVCHGAVRGSRSSVTLLSCREIWLMRSALRSNLLFSLMDEMELMVALGAKDHSQVHILPLGH